MADPTAELEATKVALQALQPLEPEQASRALRWLAEILDVPVSPTQGVAGTSALSGISRDAPNTVVPVGVDAQVPPSPEDFIALKRPTSNVERIACLGYYLSEFRDTPHFKVIDIVALNTEAAQGSSVMRIETSGTRTTAAATSRE